VGTAREPLEQLTGNRTSALATFTAPQIHPMKTNWQRALLRRIHELESQGRPEAAVSLLMAELQATKILRSPGRPVIPDHARRLTAVFVSLKLIAQAEAASQV
jgi:hypothetical protein